MSEVSVEEFKKFKEKLDNFITKEADTFYFRNLMESINDPNYMYEVSKIIDYVGDERTAQEIEELFLMLRSKGEAIFVERDKKTTQEDIVNYSLRGLAYFCLVEALNENSSFSEGIVQDIKKKYGDRYLEIIERIDKAYLSVDGKKILATQEEELPNDETMKKYLVMKTWQDRQRTYSMKRIRPMYPKELEYIGEKEPNLIRLHKKTLIKRASEDMKKRKLISIEEIAKYYEAGIEPELIKLVGGKAVGLAKLKSKGIDIPKTYVIPANVNIEDINLEQVLDSSKKYAFRSSADIEDGGNHSFAGMFDSYLDVEVKDGEEKLKAVKRSIDNPRVKRYMELNSIENRPSMSVIVQEFREPELSGVWIGNSNNSGTLEWTSGNGEKLVSGKVNPTREEWIDGKETSGIETIKAGEQIGKQLIKIQQIMSDDNSVISDMEWCVLDGKLVLLQHRPVTRKIENNKTISTKEEIEQVFKGSPASEGEALGHARFIKKLDEIGEWNKGDILMAWFTDPDWMEVMSNSSGLITAVGGLLCHSAIIARELGIPCVTGLGKKAMRTIWNENEIYVNGSTGEVCTARVYEKKKKMKEVKRNDKSFKEEDWSK